MNPIPWTEGNSVQLLENGEEFFPRLLEVIGQARREILLETFILAEDGVGKQLCEALAGAARRGASVRVTVDGFGTADLPRSVLRKLREGGVELRQFDPRARLFGLRTNPFRRLHRKLVSVDGEIAFVGGLNYGEDHLRSFEGLSKQDYAVEVGGPVVSRIRHAMEWSRRRGFDSGRPPAGTGASRVRGTARAALVLRDDPKHSQDIEHMYRRGFRTAREEIIVANAYFFPGHRLLRDLRDAARRGVSVHLVLQGQADLQCVRWAAGTLYDYLLRGGVHIHEYQERSLHAKVAVVDRAWATVGSSNLDPLSLFLNLEANLVVEDAAFAGALRRCLDRLIRNQCREMRAPKAGPGTPVRNLAGIAAFHLLRKLPRLAGWLPAHEAPHRRRS